jgi:hypothetical protein
MKRFQLGQLNLGRLRSCLLFGLAGSHAAERDASKNRIPSDKPARSNRLLSSTRFAGTPEEILKTTERQWPTRYY